MTDLSSREKNAYRAVFIYQSARSKLGLDNWTTESQWTQAAIMLQEMGYPFDGSLEDLRKRFVNMRKSGIFRHCCMLGTAKASKGSRS